jgi:hypothetical protein
MYNQLKIKDMNLEIDNQKIEDSFNRIASELMNEYVLKAENTHYRITEIEFYYYVSKNHEDNYIHKHDLQKEKGKWYFHGSGVDLTFGSNEVYGGILLRAIYNIKTEKYIYGPIKIITEIFSNMPSAFDTNISFGLIPAENTITVIEQPIKAPRVGLNEKKNPNMYEELYRYLIMPKQKHAEKERIAKSMVKQGFSKEEINKIWG